MRYNIFVSIARLAAIFIPASVILYFALHTGTLPDVDYWGVLNSILTNDGFSFEIASWFRRANEHVIVIPKLLYALNILLTGGSNTALALIAWCAALLQVLLLLLVIPADIRKEPVRGTILMLIISVFIFTTKAAWNWFAGMSGTTWMTANLFSVAAMVLMYRFHVSRSQGWLWGSMLAGVLANLCYSTPLALWPALLLGAFLLRFRPRHLLLIATVAAAAYLFYLLGYNRPSNIPDAERSLYQIALFVLNFLGGLFISGPDYALFGRILALSGIALSGMVVWLRAREGGAWREECAPWLMLQVYALGNGILSGISRSGFGINTALASRYASLPAFFWLSLCVLWLLYFWRTERLRSYLPLPSVVIALLIFQMYTGSFVYVKKMFHKQELKEMAAVSIVTGVYDESIFIEAVTPVSAELLIIMDRLKQVAHVPFDKWLEGWPRPGAKMDLGQMLVADEKRSLGSFDVIEPFASDSAKVRGWSYVANEKVRCVAIVNRDGIVRGLAIPSLNRPDVATFLKISTIKIGWEGYTRLVDGDRDLRACVLLDRTGKWYQLRTVLPRPTWSVK